MRGSAADIFSKRDREMQDTTQRIVLLLKIASTEGLLFTKTDLFLFLFIQANHILVHLEALLGASVAHAQKKQFLLVIHSFFAVQLESVFF